MAIEPQILAFGFSNLAMLGWLGAAAAPLLIHLWSRRRHREVAWAAMRFLQAAMKRNARRLRLQQWLLLAVRTLIIVLVVVALAEPYGEGMIVARRAAPTHWVVVVDASYSMGYERDGESMLERAKQLGAEIASSGGVEDRFTVIELSDSPRVVINYNETDRRATVDAIRSIPLTESGGDLLATLALVVDAIAECRSAHPSVDRQEVVFLSDLQRVTWQALQPPSAPIGTEPSEAGSVAPAGSRWSELARQASLLLVDPTPDRRGNLVVTRLSTPEAVFTRGVEVEFEATIREFGDAPRRDVAVELVVDNQGVGEQIVDVAPGTEASVRFRYRFDSSGAYRLEVRAPGDELSIDNHRWLAAEVVDEVRVLCVAGKPGAARYVADALDPDPADLSPIRPVVRSMGELASVEFDRFDCLVFCNVAQLSSNEVARLSRYVNQGGGVVFFLGDEVRTESYRPLADGDAPLLPRLLGPVMAELPPRLDPLDYRHPIVAPFRGREGAGLLTTPVARYHRLERSADGNSQVALAFANGDPLIITRQVGQGRSVVVATDASLSSTDPHTAAPWTMWPTWPSFLPIVREMVNYGAGARLSDQSVLVGETLTGSRVSAGETPRVTRPDGRTDLVRLRETRYGWEWSYDRTDVSGIYAIESDPADGADALRLDAVNVDPHEGDLTKISPDDLPADIEIRHTWQPEGEESVERLVAGTEWPAMLLTTALAMMLLESWMAWYFGRGVV